MRVTSYLAQTSTTSSFSVALPLGEEEKRQKVGTRFYQIQLMIVLIKKIYKGNYDADVEAKTFFLYGLPLEGVDLDL